VKTFEGATELFPGLRTLPAYGHTPGHTYYILEDGGEKLVFMGDTIHAPGAQFDDPDITIGSTSWPFTPGLMVSALDVLGAQEALAPIESPATASQMTLTCTFIPRSSSGLPA
jgi:glyoxylase-like metal-dependent hydrolase (beta-lactamase superfamily II)